MTRALVIVAMALAILGCLGALLWFGQRGLMYFPDRHVPRPDAVGLAAGEPVVFTTDDGVRLHGWFLPVPAASFTVMVFNGNAGNRAYRAQLGQALRARGLAVLLFDYRGFGENEGSPGEAGLYADAVAARRYLLTRDDVREGRLVYLGESLGAAVALELAASHPPAALVLRSPFSSMADMARLHYPMLPTRWLLRDRYASIDKIAHVTAPVLVVAGDRDGIVPLAHSRRLYDAVTSRKSFVVIEGADHNDAALTWGPELVDAIVRFLPAQ